MLKDSIIQLSCAKKTTDLIVRGADPPPRPPEPSGWLLSWLSTGLSIDGTPTERKNAIGLDLSNKDGSDR